jgi:hypothetical protein
MDRLVVGLYEAVRSGESARARAHGASDARVRSIADQYLFQAAPDFVTPADLYTTTSLTLLGTMDTD